MFCKNNFIFIRVGFKLVLGQQLVSVKMRAAVKSLLTLWRWVSLAFALDSAPLDHTRVVDLNEVCCLT